jgi:hypothetical protein
MLTRLTLLKAPLLNAPFLAACIMSATPQQTYALVNQCHQSSGELLFTDQPCPATTWAESVEISQPMITPGLTPSEITRLQKLTGEVDKSVASRMLNSENRTRRAQQSHAISAKACALARDQLKKLRRTLRSGYPLKNARVLKDREDDLRPQKDAQC